MRVVGFSYKKISVEKKKEIDGKIEIKTDIEVKEIKKALNLTSTDTALLLMIIKKIEER